MLRALILLIPLVTYGLDPQNCLQTDHAERVHPLQIFRNASERTTYGKILLKATTKTGLDSAALKFLVNNESVQSGQKKAALWWEVVRRTTPPVWENLTGRIFRAGDEVVVFGEKGRIHRGSSQYLVKEGDTWKIDTARLADLTREALEKKVVHYQEHPRVFEARMDAMATRVIDRWKRKATSLIAGIGEDDLRQLLLLETNGKFHYLDFNKHTSIDAFFARSMNNAVIKALRRHKKVDRVEVSTEKVQNSGLATDGISPFERAESVERAGRIEAILAELPEQEKKLLEDIIEGRTTAEIASRHGLKEATAKVRVHRLRQKLKQRLEEAGIQPPKGRAKKNK